MIVYRAQQQERATASCLDEIGRTLRRFEERGFAGHEDAVGLLIEFGEFETAVVDALRSEANLVSPMGTLLREASLLIGHLFYWSWENVPVRAGLWATRLRHAVTEIGALPLPRALQVRVSEGFAYYGLAPEAYLEAARRFHREVGPVGTVCLGIRSIGTSLSSVVSATLEEQGCPVESYTVRCEGHPFDRHLHLDPAMTERFQQAADRYYLIVDEGPGLSGSTLCCVADRLSELGVPDDRIVFFPGHDTDGAALFSETARRRWPRHRKYVVDFEEVWVRSGRLTSFLPPGRLADLSGGRWRPWLFRDESHYPAVQPWHERRKYLHRESTTTGTSLLLKFAGFGRYGESTHARAVLLAQEGFHPPVLGLRHGFLVMEFVPGRCMRRTDIDAPFLDRVTRYLARLRHMPATAVAMAPDELRQMIEVNIAEGLGPRWAERFRQSGLCVPATDHVTGATDGRMMLHEWLQTASGPLKTDGVDHYADHFSPSCSDSAWDLVACMVEWGLGPSMQSYLIGQYGSATGDIRVAQRLPFYRTAYLAHRLGYATMAAQALGPQSPDGRRFEAMTRGYACLLKQELARL